MANLNTLIHDRWPAPLITLLETAGKVAHSLGYSLYVVGGAVRDLLLGYTNLDIDLVVEGDGVAVARQLATRLRSKVVVHDRFGTAKLYYDGKGLDIITARRETYPHPGALPVVQPGSLKDDLFRRDFTINTLALRVEPGPFGEMVDLYGGQQDLENRLIRILHPKSFVDDATRILRALRYEQRLGFQLEKATAEVLRSDVAMLDTISSDRLRHEMELILKEPYPERVLRRLDEVGVMSKLLPSWKGDRELEARLTLARQAAPSPALYLALFVYPLEPADMESFISRLHFPAKTAHIMRHTSEIKNRLPFLAKEGIHPSQISSLVKDYSPTAILANALSAESSAVRQSLRLYLDKLRYVRLSLSGDDLIKMGVEPGPRLGQLLSRLLEAKLDGQVGSREEEVRMVRFWLSQ